jgi:DNA-binding NarL/FixJ family response regulator
VPLTTTPVRDSIRLLVIDDHPVVRDGLATLLAADDSITIVASATTAAEAVGAAREGRPDVILLDLRLPDALGIEAMERLREAAPLARIVIFTAYAQHAGLKAAMAAGIDGCLLKDASGPDLLRAIRQVAHGERVFDARTGHSSWSHRQGRSVGEGLTRRECDVVRMVALGKTNSEIGESLGLTAATAKTYLHFAMQKLGARNRVEAIRRAYEEGLL